MLENDHLAQGESASARSDKPYPPARFGPHVRNGRASFADVGDENPTSDREAAQSRSSGDAAALSSKFSTSLRSVP